MNLSKKTALAAECPLKRMKKKRKKTKILKAVQLPKREMMNHLMSPMNWEEKERFSHPQRIALFAGIKISRQEILWLMTSKIFIPSGLERMSLVKRKAKR